MARYADGVAWIAEEDEPDEQNTIRIAEMISVALLSDLFGKPTAKVADDIYEYRRRHNIASFGRTRKA